ncbi:hypothetical protein NZD89_28560 (plasmid) [Alicyclobacillus fastidiosus]|uniref:Uncharacterized protein n=1 Tax=Alicyclobacillus fastidiosus TaxID=392011 RepID=A0ABY6ZQU0_9BACL|nr:hypothetical protein [Alicyclobacillus fastidiosus]WAH44812.1 hypothetical protein NZD89_28560 [Alicyclobacillus fastidiosus]GMA65773.1 hypothetical protein GCM10025859_62130 [Alicyclobacillus fastidiosus]
MSAKQNWQDKIKARNEQLHNSPTAKAVFPMGIPGQPVERSDEDASEKTIREIADQVLDSEKQNGRNAEVQNSAEAQEQNSREAEQQTSVLTEVQKTAPAEVHKSVSAELHISADAEIQKPSPAEMQKTADAEMQTSVSAEQQKSRSAEMQKAKDFRRMTIHVPNNQFKQLKQISLDEDLTMLEIGEEMVNVYIAHKLGK